MKDQELHDFLDQKAEQYNHPNFIEEDPISIPHQYTLRQDIEIAGFLTATVSWGNRKSILKSAGKMMEAMGNSPYDFVMSFSENNLQILENKAVHRTFNAEDFTFFLRQLKAIYQKNDSLEPLFKTHETEYNFYHSLERFRTEFLKSDPQNRAKKHVSSTYNNASAKRLMMFLRWMVRKDNRKVDFGIWDDTDQRLLSVPLDVHTGNISRKLELITRKQNDWKTVEELDLILRKFDPRDPAKYDFALFGIGVSKDF